MNNGALTTARVLLSGALAMTALCGSIWLMHDGITVPIEYWIVVLGGISGVTGIDLLAYLINRKDGTQI